MRRFAFVLVCCSLFALSEASAATPAPSTFSAGVRLSHITYREPGLMRESGVMYGVAVSYRGIGPSMIGKIDGTLAFGEVDYVGSLSDGTPLTIKNIQDTLFELRGVVGPADFAEGTSSFLPYIGFGYRYLFDGANVGPGGYRRESNYLYIPVGIEGIPLTRGAWSFGFTVEYDLFLQGRQYSYLSDANPGFNDVENRQSSGQGYRASLRFVRSGERDITIEPFYIYWNIKESSISLLTYYGVPYAYLVEPDNHSKELGIRFTLSF